MAELINPPSGADIWKILLRLYAEQEGVVIRYQLESNGKIIEGSTNQ